MRLGTLGVLLAAMLVSGCGDGAAPPQATSAEDKMRQAVAQVAERKDAAPAPAAARVALKTPLPGGVIPDFDFTVGSDVSMKVQRNQRIVMLVARETSANDALGILAGQFAAAGFESGSVSTDKDNLMQGFWTPGEARGMLVVEAGGTYVNVMARAVDPDSEFAEDGYSTLVTVNITSP
jgi:hypothetical protein